MNSPTDNERLILQELEEELWREETRFNLDRMKELLTHDFMEIGRSGKIYNLNDTLAVPAQPIDITLPLEDFQVYFITSEVVQTLYNTAVKYSGSSLYGRRSSIWVKSGSGWRLRFHQGTPYEPGA